MGGVAIFLQIPSGSRADGDGAGIPLGRHRIGPKSHWDVGRKAKKFEGESRDAGTDLGKYFGFH